MVKKEKKPTPQEELNEDIDLLEDFEEPTEIKKTKKEDSVTDDLSPGELPPEELLEEDILEELPAEEPAEDFLDDDLLDEEQAPIEVEEEGASVSDEILHVSSDIPVQLVAVIGKTTVSVKDLMNYQMGQVLDLGRPPGETVDLVASGKLFARGELVDIDGKLGVRIVKLLR